MTGVRHDNVVQLFQVGEAEGWLYLVLELVSGGTLKESLENPYAPKDAARLLVAIAGAVDAIHRAKLLHRDLEPSNIFLDREPGAPRELARPKVGDLGIAYGWNDPDVSLPTASLTGPDGDAILHRAEQLASDGEKLPGGQHPRIGTILYHVLTGRGPFVGATIIDTLEQVRSQEPVPPRRLDPKIPRDLETICLKCLQKDPGRRYAWPRLWPMTSSSSSTTARFQHVPCQPSKKPGDGVAAARLSRGLVYHWH